MVSEMEYYRGAREAYNLPLLRKERDWVAEQMTLPFAESQLDMEVWSSADSHGKTCGTTYCVAGHLAATIPDVDYQGFSKVFADGEFHDIASWAGRELGLSWQEAMALFYSKNESVLSVFDKLIERAEAAEREEL